MGGGGRWGLVGAPTGAVSATGLQPNEPRQCEPMKGVDAIMVELVIKLGANTVAVTLSDGSIGKLAKAKVRPPRDR
jgi:hypothetical protein